MKRMKIRTLVRDTFFIILGSIIFAIGLDCFEIPYGIAAGGITGLATVFHALAATAGIELPIGAQTIAMNIILIVFVIRGGNKSYVVRSVVGFMVSSLFIDLLAPVLPVLGKHDLILASLWGGIICGIGLGLVFRAGANTGGTDIIAQAFAKRFLVPMGTAVIIVDMVVIIISIPVFSLESGLYSMLAMFITGKVLDYVVDGPKSERAAYIISKEHDAIAHEILYSLNRGCTELQARGVWSGNTKPVLLVVLNRSESIQLKEIVAEIDSEALVFVSEVHEAFGEGFKSFQAIT
ncbi:MULTISPECIES: YitT family protein [Atopobiaceae]|uniref:YitT family protein n=1 Tax=Atopobiaceae TaxID=1643824 RepID=UPI00034E711D|nr:MULTISPECIES: YitT family protein [Atopobiaceae]EPD77105.1 hypothetical protein HMPREF1527_01526 [Atopobium sp. oral taxon 199 str. F0494]